MLNELSKVIFKNNEEKGFYDKPKNIGEMLCLMHSEVSEALEADRKNRYSTGIESAPDGNDMELVSIINGYEDNNLFTEMYKKNIKGTFEEEMADIIIRVLDMCGFKGIDIDAHIPAKIRYNKLRPHKHGKKY